MLFLCERSQQIAGQVGLIQAQLSCVPNSEQVLDQRNELDRYRQQFNEHAYYLSATPDTMSELRDALILMADGLRELLLIMPVLADPWKGLRELIGQLPEYQQHAA